MTKRAKPGLNSQIVLDPNLAAPLYRQLYERLRSRIMMGQLESGARLPSTRGLAAELGVSRNTTALAYELLLLEGYIESRVGDGTRVANLRLEDHSVLPSSHYQGETFGIVRHDAASLESYTKPATIGVFRAGQPETAYFPYKLWSRLVAKHAYKSLPFASQYQNAAGYLPLREAIAAHIGITRGVHCSPEQIILTAGSQGGLDLIARVLLKSGDQAWVEDPGYTGAHEALLRAGATLVGVPIDREGLDVQTGRILCPNARVAVVTPSHQFPTGVTMSLSRRLALLEWSVQAEGWIVEDDYDSEYRFSGRPLEALQGLDGAGRVLYLGTFSKVLFPALRLGYLVVPPVLLERFLTARHYTDVHLPVLEQMALADFIAEGHFARHLRKMRGIYLERRNTLVENLRTELNNLLEIVVPEAGMHLVAWLPSELKAPNISFRAAAKGVYVTPVSKFSLRPLARDGLVLGFANATSQALRDGVKILAGCILGEVGAR